MESSRIRLAFAHDPHFAVALTGIEVLPHQLEAVYERMLPQAMLRFLLADDPGAGKTIMSGLLMKELGCEASLSVLVVSSAARRSSGRTSWPEVRREFELMTSASIRGR